MLAMFIDDERFPPEILETQYKTVLIARSTSEAIDMLISYGCPDYISFDHDLGGEDTAVKIVNWMIDEDINTNGSFIGESFNFYVHSQNPVGAQNIKAKLDGYLKFRKSKDLI